MASWYKDQETCLDVDFLSARLAPDFVHALLQDVVEAKSVDRLGAGQGVVQGWRQRQSRAIQHALDVRGDSRASTRADHNFINIASPSGKNPSYRVPSTAYLTSKSTFPIETAPFRSG